MLNLNPDLINSCRVCRTPNQDGECECLYQFASNHEKNPVLSDAGILYENLFNISLNTHSHYPQFLCNSCDLQMKLFQKIKDRAYKTLTYLQNLYGEDIHTGEEYIQDIPLGDAARVIPKIEKQEYAEEFQENEMEEYQKNIPTVEFGNCQKDSNQKQDIMAKVYPEYIESLHQYNTDSEHQDNAYDTSSINGSEAFEQKTLYKEEDVENTIASDTENILPQETALTIDILENEYDLKIASSEEMVIDKNDYVTEIYELLDDERSTDNCAKNIENVVEDDIYTDEKSEVFNDVEYIEDDEYYTRNDLTNQNTKEENLSETKKIAYKCMSCQLEFKTLQEYKLHNTQVHKKKHKCNVCSKELRSAAGLQNHMKLHNGESAYQCEICHKTFKQKCHFQYHMNNYNNVRNFKCNVCQKAFITNADLKTHTRVHTGIRPYVCNICGKNYLMMEHLKTHLITHTTQYFPCEICDKKYTNHKTLRLHVRTIHEEKKKYICSICSKAFRRKHHLEYHTKWHQKINKYIDSPNENVDNPAIVKNGVESDVDFIEELDSIDDPGFIALNDNL